MGLGLPVIVDIAISLVFIYLSLSLLSSEVQELLTTLLQWRAVHLKESIGFMVGNAPEQLADARELANRIYEAPLLRSLNHQSQAGFVSAMRTLQQLPGQLLRQRSQTHIFGQQTTGPSYIPASIFSRSLLQTFDFVKIARQLMTVHLRVTIEAMVPDSKTFEPQLTTDIRPILTAFETQKISWHQTVRDLAVAAKDNEAIFDPTRFQRCFGTPEAIARLTDKLQISLADTIQAVRQYQAIKTLEQASLVTIAPERFQHCSLEEAQTSLKELQHDNDPLRHVLKGTDEQTYLLLALILTHPDTQDLVDDLPSIPHGLGVNLETLASSALGKIDNLAQEARQLEQEISQWFDRSMERSQGVYNRNAKLVALFIALCITVSANADTLYMVEHFAQEKTLTASVLQMVNRLPEDMLLQPDTMSQFTAQTTLPLGWTPETIQRQKQSTLAVLQSLPFPIQRLPGWGITSLAIAMGASFWYDLLKRFINIRHAGPAPFPAPASETSSNTSSSTMGRDAMT